MNIVQAVMIYVTLMFSTIFSWFILGQYLVGVFAMLYTAMDHSSDTQGIISNCIVATNFTFIVFLILWTVWFIYVVQSDEYEQSFQTYGGRRF